MPKLKPETHAARRTAILDAAEICFARSGFHATSVQDICKAANVSSGALYIYFKSKESLIAGICERNRHEFAERFAMLSSAPDFLSALKALGGQYLVDEPVYKRVLCVEIGAEATRNTEISNLFQSIDRDVENSFMQLFERLHAEGRIAPAIEISNLTSILMMLGDGLFWRRAINPDLDIEANLKAVVDVIGMLTNPVANEQPTTPAGTKLSNRNVDEAQT